MDPVTQQALNQFVQQILASAQNAATWTAGQAPLVVQEWLRWQATEASILLAAGVLAVFVAIGSAVMAYRSSAYSDQRFGFSLLAGGCAAIGIPTTLFNAMALAKVLTAPRVLVLEKFADLIK